MIREINAILREDHIRASGTGRGRERCWQTPTQGGTSAGPGHNSLYRYLRNLANAAAVAGLRVGGLLLACHYPAEYFLSA